MTTLELKFREAIDKYGLFDARTPEKRRLIAAYSGGADSAALLDLLVGSADEYGIEVEAVHVMHGIRGEEAERDAEFCRARCAGYGIPCRTVRRDVPALAREWGCGIEEAGRRARYEVFSEICAERGAFAVATAHHADDNLETVILNLARGSGTRGLAGIPPVRDGVIRPLILCSREEIDGYCAEKGVEFVSDSTNQSDIYARNYVRHEIVPRLKKLNPQAAAAVSRQSGLLRSDDGRLCDEAGALLEAAQKDGRFLLDSFGKAHPAVASRALREAAGREINATEALAALRRGEDTRISVGNSLTLEIYRGGFRFIPDTGRNAVPAADYMLRLEPEVPVSPEGAEFAVTVTACDCDAPGNIYKKSIYAAIDSAKIVGELYVRPRRPGDRMRVRGISRTAKNLLQEAGIPASDRASLPVVCDGVGPLWIPGAALRDGAAPGKDAQTLRLIFARRE